MKEISTDALSTAEGFKEFYESLGTEEKIITFAAVIGVKDWAKYPTPMEEKREEMINAAYDYLNNWNIELREFDNLVDEVAAVMTHVFHGEPYTAESVFWTVNKKKMS